MNPQTHPARASHERGQSLVELAISLTVMLLLLSGAVSFGMALFSYVSIRDAAQEGALWGSFNPFLDSNNDGQFQYGEPVNTALIRQRVRGASSSPIDLTNTTILPDAFITVAATNHDGSGNPLACEGYGTDGSANGIRVTVQYDYPIIMPFIGGIVGSQKIHLTASVTDSILEPKCP